MIVLLLIVAVIAANLPWSSERIALVISPRNGVKREWMRLLEWLALFGLIGLVAAGLEMRAQGEIEPQGWEFWVINLCLFAVFALPGFTYRHDLQRRLRKRQIRGARPSAPLPKR